MKIKSVRALSGGEILAEPLSTKEKEILIPKGTVIKKDYLPLLSSIEMKSVMIEDPYEEFENPNKIADQKLMQRLVDLVQSLMEKHIYHDHNSLRGFEMIANEIVKSICEWKNQMVFDLDERETNLYEHTVYVTILSLKAAVQLKLDKKTLYEIALGCLLHDIGLRYITAEYKDCDWTKNSPEEVFDIKKHTILGYSALDEETWIPEISKKMVLAHHERNDGSGFPMRRKYRETECKLIQVCDSLDCMISGIECVRTPVWDALDNLQKEAGGKYEKKIVDIISSMTARYPVGTKVKLNLEDTGVVIQQTEDPQKPVVMIPKDKMKKYNLKLEKDISILGII